MKKIIVLLVVFLSWVSIASASLEVKEVMYNPEVKTDHLWVKVYNNSGSDVTLTDWSIADYDGTAWHYHAINADGSSLLSANSYAIVAKASATTISTFKTKNPDISGLLFYGNLTIGNEGIIGVSRDKKNVEGKLSYGGASDFVSPEVIDESTSSGASNSISSSSSAPSDDVSESILKITTKIISPKIAVAGIPISLSSLTTTNRGETYNLGKFIWNFGDGMQLQVKESKPFDYIYDYPGEYVLNLSYFDNSFVEVPDATSRVTLKVIPADIYISSVGDYTDPYVEIENKSKYEVDLSGWIITGISKSFIFPEGMTLLSGKKIKLSSKITGFNGDDIRYVAIQNPSKEVVATYPQKSKNVRQKSAQASSVLPSVEKDNSPKEDSQVINLNDLGASAGDSKIDISKPVYSIIGLIVIIGLGITSFLFIKKKKDVPDYVERGISAKDMTIME